MYVNERKYSWGYVGREWGPFTGQKITEAKGREEFSHTVNEQWRLPTSLQEAFRSILAARGKARSISRHDMCDADQDGRVLQSLPCNFAPTFLCKTTHELIFSCRTI